MREVAQNLHRMRGERRLQRPVGRSDAVPAMGHLDRLGDPGRLVETVLHGREVEPPLHPRRYRLGPDRRTAVRRATPERRALLGFRDLRYPFAAEKHHTAAQGGIVQHVARLVLVVEAQQERPDAALHDAAHGLQTRVDRREQYRLEQPGLRQRHHAQRDLGDDAQSPLGTDEQLLDVRPERRPHRRLRLHHLTGREHGGQRHDQVLDAAVAGRELPGRPRRHPAAHGGTVERLRRVAERQTGIVQRPFQPVAAHAGLRGNEQVDAVDRRRRVHP